jgi:formylglycine-generating enzyme
VRSIAATRRRGALFLLLALLLAGCTLKGRPSPAGGGPGATAAPPAEQAPAGPTGSTVAGGGVPGASAPTPPDGMVYLPAGTFQLGGGPSVRLSAFFLDLAEVSIAQFRRYVDETGIRTRAEEEGGYVYEAGWVRKAGWSWRAPFGTSAADEEPAVHLTWSEAAAYCTWQGKRLPTEAEWEYAASVETRTNSSTPLVTGRKYPWPTGESVRGANICDRNCENGWRETAHDDGFARHSPVRALPPGINGLYGMAANVWEWVADWYATYPQGELTDPKGPANGSERVTRGGSWWYGSLQARADHRAGKDPEFWAVYIGFRCAKDAP